MSEISTYGWSCAFDYTYLTIIVCLQCFDNRKDTQSLKYATTLIYKGFLSGHVANSGRPGKLPLKWLYLSVLGLHAYIGCATVQIICGQTYSKGCM